MADSQPRLLVSLAILRALATLWGASFSFIKIGVETITPVTLIAVRSLIAGSLLLLILRLRGLKLPTEAHNTRRFLIQAGLNSVVPFTLVAWGEQHVDAGLAVILNLLTPVFAFLINAGITRHEAVTVPKVFGVAAGLLGMSEAVRSGIAASSRSSGQSHQAISRSMAMASSPKRLRMSLAGFSRRPGIDSSNSTATTSCW